MANGLATGLPSDTVELPQVHPDAPRLKGRDDPVDRRHSDLRETLSMEQWSVRRQPGRRTCDLASPLGDDT